MNFISKNEIDVNMNMNKSFLSEEKINAFDIWTRNQNAQILNLLLKSKKMDLDSLKLKEIDFRWIFEECKTKLEREEKTLVIFNSIYFFDVHR